MPQFRIKAVVTVTYIYDTEADTIEEAIAAVEDGEMEDCSHEIDSSAPFAQEYTIEGQMGWNFVERDENDAPVIPKEKADD